MQAHPPEPITSNAELLRLGDDAISFYLLEDTGRYTVFDAALPAYFELLLDALNKRGADLSAIDALVLTHAHPDHIGFAERLRAECGARVMVHHADAGYATTAEQPSSERPPSDYLQRWPQAQTTFASAIAAGVMEIAPVAEVETFTDGDVLDVPGHPRVIATPGHTPGQCSFLLPEHDALVLGDTLEGFNVLTGRYGPQIGPDGTNTSSEQALASLDRLEEISVGALLFGHGAPWRWGTAAALASARALGRS